MENLDAVIRIAADVKGHYDKKHLERGMGVARRLAELPEEEVPAAIIALGDEDRQALFDAAEAQGKE